MELGESNVSESLCASDDCLVVAGDVAAEHDEFGIGTLNLLSFVLPGLDCLTFAAFA